MQRHRPFPASARRSFSLGSMPGGSMLGGTSVPMTSPWEQCPGCFIFGKNWILERWPELVRGVAPKANQPHNIHLAFSFEARRDTGAKPWPRASRARRERHAGCGSPQWCLPHQSPNGTMRKATLLENPFPNGVHCGRQARVICFHAPFRQFLRHVATSPQRWAL